MENTGILKFRGGSNRHHVTVKGLRIVFRFYKNVLWPIAVLLNFIGKK